MNRHQAEVVAYLQEENRVLREQLGGRRLRFTDAHRRRLAAKGRLVGRRLIPVEYMVAANEGHSIDRRENKVELMTRVARLLEDAVR